MTDYPAAHTVEDFRANLAAVRTRIDAAARAADRDPSDVRLLPVSKTVEADRLRNAVAAGCDWLGENKVQEAKRKHGELADTGVKWAVIGHLQTNKAKDVAAIADEFQALDSMRVAEALDRRLTMVERTLDVYVQVNTSGEESKFGLAPDELPAFLAQVVGFETLRVQGLMTLAVNSPDEEQVRGCFRLLRELRDRVRDTDPDLIGAGELSMGMSGDYPLAIAEGSTCVRVGQAIFGARATPDSHYWPAG
ncbi:YggS family pyridoxal phosphate-dependent enzyme [Gordonia sp. (in: high G+C Gram-positive bacteria)]|uniref:YggS family pyridoxal phosphate-dependent enzyme n=1 Tax=Gordonia sp. (in: high G+C Gram-positive bacteria) TaxID=84139 RepID=UPI0039E21DBA